ncbi:MAG: helix-turn-helix domain-containing protein [Leptolyngbyaceae cyanobacterium MO_188.B28]|nr:helix-turn-helix domain-containing protein [Leptolyngbyaceae cyanobacterium MO_188.B28]
MPLALNLLLESLPADLGPEYRRRIEIMQRAVMGQSQAEICAALGCAQETARYWMAVAEAGEVYKWKSHPLGRPKTINDQYLERLQNLVNQSPRDYGYPFQRWTAQWLSKHLAKELGIEVSGRHVNRLLKQMGLSTQPKLKKQKTAPSEPLSQRRAGITIGDLRSTSSPDFLEPSNFNSSVDVHQ